MKKFYNRGRFFGWLTLAAHMPLIARWWFLRWRAGTPKIERGMAFWTDIKDWFGGYPFEVATPRAVIEAFERKGFTLTSLFERRGSGCNEFVFQRNA